MTINSIRVRNLRSINDSNDIEIKNINFFLGSNSTGKSSVIRLFPLLKQSIETRTTAPILWYGRLVDFGDITSAIKNSSDERSMMIGISGTISSYIQDHYSFYQQTGYIPREQGGRINFDVRIHLKEGKSKSTAAHKYEINLPDNHIVIEFNDDSGIAEILINNTNFSEYSQKFNSAVRKGLFRHITWKTDRVNQYKIAENPALNSLTSILRNNLHHKVSNHTIAQLISQFRPGEKTAFLKRLQGIKGPQSWINFTRGLTTSTETFLTIIDTFNLLMLPYILESINLEISKTSTNTRYISPLRATAERYYRAQELAVDEIDPEGRNLHIFLNSLSKAQKQRFQLWLSENFDIQAQSNLAEGHINITLQELSSGDDFNMADMGFGFSQVLPILTQIWSALERTKGQSFTQIICIEQPELHLHPKLQAKLALVLSRSVSQAISQKSDLRFIIETHSEALINKMGMLINSSTIDSDRVGIYLFNRSTSGVEISRTNYTNNGFLENWPIDFFDY
ncbi:AAA family ATPase [Chitinimonas prasina]|uniref:AAA family ATPase n=1 Tax=Chitinimonas prasina TaxID=1434937 RepID=UPI0024E08A86|nr:AAA family ATPase [Chitinimonas prasina]